MKKFGLKTTTFAVAAALALAGVVYTSVASSAVEATVIKVVDGDTIDVDLNGERTRIRLLNVDTPEMSEPECFAVEATQYMEERLPQGTSVSLRFDKERTDRYDRTLAAVYLGDELLNATLAERGLGTTVVFGENDRYQAEVANAEERAQRQGLGIHGDLPEHCEIFDQFQQQLEALQSSSYPSSDAVAAITTQPEVQSYIAEIDQALAGPTSLATALADLDSVADEIFAHMLTAGGLSVSSLDQEINDYRSARKSLVERGDQIEAEERKAEEERKKRKEEEHQRRVAEQRRIEQQRNQQQPRQQQVQRSSQTGNSYSPVKPNPQPAPNPQPVPNPQPAPKGNPNPNPNTGNYNGPNGSYTGPRCYAPGGKSWRPC